jgi:hypothetical protein
MDIQYFDDIAHKAVRIPLKGANICIKGIEDRWYVVLRTTTEQDEPGQFTTFVTLLRISDESDDLGEEPITRNLDLLDYTY